VRASTPDRPPAKETDVLQPRRLIAIGAALAASALLFQGSAAGSDDDHARDRGRERTLRFDVQFSPFTITDIGEPDLSAGDVIVFNDTLSRDDTRAGDEVGSCIVVDPMGLANCTAVVRLGEDTISFSFVNAPPPLKRLAITGGSGRYRTAHGDGVLLENGDAENTGTLTLTVLTN
jgi:hypothetical protein